MKKTTLTVAAFAALILLPRVVPALKNFVSLDPRDIALVWDLPVPKPQEIETGQLRTQRLQVRAPQNLIDSGRQLDHFYGALLDGRPVRVLHYGDSPTTGDLITADARAMFQKQFGDGGAGFVLIAKPWAWYAHRGVELDSSQWSIDIAGDTPIKDGLHGLGGASFQGSPGAVANWSMKEGQRSAEVAYLEQPEGGTFSFEADGVALRTVETAAEDRHPAWVSFELPEGSRKFTLRVVSGRVRLYGVEFSKSKPGVLYSSLGVNGANITLLSHAFNAAHWAAELHHYRPDLVVLAYGTNESGFPKFVDSTWGGEMKAAVKRLQTALPETSILLMSPMDRGVRDDRGEIETIEALPRLVKIEARVAEETGVAFFNTFQAMGGEGTMARWYTSEPRLVGADYIHPMPAGAKIVGELLYGALRDGYNEYKLRQLSKREGRTAK
ncbi:MAG TPA: GDSL-type esterase/lipase family protein [Bryobacteraceae bacterium]|jgi:lysophospholipase L1-like esterase